jgi:RimJ/RimL family protein N-acetyltransferase
MKKQHDFSRNVFIDGPHLYLSPLEETDAEMAAAWVNNPLTRIFISTKFPMSLHQEHDWVKTVNSSKKVVVMIVLKNTNGEDKPIGILGTHDINQIDQTAETGAHICIEERGKGYGTEAKMILLDYLFNTLNLRKIISRVYAFNTASQKYSEKCGYTKEGVLKEHIFHNGSFVDLVYLAIFKDTFGPKWEEFKKQNEEFYMD